MNTQIVAVFCGPHDEDGQVSFRRIDAAIEAALRLNAPLVIAGDGNYGNDVRLFERCAYLRGVKIVIGLYAEQANTLSDAISIALLLKHGGTYANISTVHLVTDWWHMSRSSIFLRGELNRLVPALDVRIEEVRVAHHPPPPPRVLAAEVRGVQDYQAGNYGRSPFRPYGKPAAFHT